MHFLTKVIVVMEAAHTSFALAERIAAKIELSGEAAEAIGIDEARQPEFWREHDGYDGVFVVFGAGPDDIEAAKMWCGVHNVLIYKGDFEAALRWVGATDSHENAAADV
jgi:hypothetical protein